MEEHRPAGGYYDVGFAVWQDRQREIKKLRSKNDDLRRALRKARNCNTGTGLRICDDCQIGIDRLLDDV